MMHWFRLYNEIRDDPKVLELDDHQFRIWIGLLATASESTPRGSISARPRGLAAALHTDEPRLLETLQLCGDLDMLSYDPQTSTIEITHWHKRQPNSDTDPTNAERQQRHRQRNAVRNAPITPTPPVTQAEVTPRDRDTDRDRDIEKTSPRETQTPAAERDTPAQVVGSTPYALYEVLCEELGAAPEAPPPPRQLGIAKRLSRRYDAGDVRACLRYLLSQHWRTGPLDLASVESQIEAWILNGRPDSEPPPRRRTGAGMTPIQIAEYARALERSERSEREERQR